MKKKIPERPIVRFVREFSKPVQDLNRRLAENYLNKLGVPDRSERYWELSLGEGVTIKRNPKSSNFSVFVQRDGESVMVGILSNLGVLWIDSEKI